MDEPSYNGQVPAPDAPPSLAPAPERRLTREDKIIYWSVAIALLILTPLVLYIAFRARTGM